jgi:hypothetical protein
MGQGGGHVWDHHVFNLLLSAPPGFSNRRFFAHHCGMLLMAVLTPRGDQPIGRRGRYEDRCCQKPEIPQRDIKGDF